MKDSKKCCQIPKAKTSHVKGGNKIASKGKK